MLELDSQAADGSLGQVSEGLRFLAGLGFEVHRSWLVPRQALRSQDDVMALNSELESLLSTRCSYVMMADAPAGMKVEASATAAVGSVPAQEGGSAVHRSWSDLVRTAVGKPWGLVIQEVVEGEAIGVASSVNLLTGADDIIVEYTGRERGRRPAGPLRDRTLGDVVTSTSHAAVLRGQPVCLWWSCSNGKLRWRRLMEIPRPPLLQSYSAQYSGTMLPGVSRPLDWSVDCELVSIAWSSMLEEVFDIVINPLLLLRRFYGRSYVNVGLLRAAGRAGGLDDVAIDALMAYAPTERGLSLAFRPAMVALLPRIARWAARRPDFEDAVKEEATAAWNRIKEVSRPDLKGMESHEEAEIADMVIGIMRRSVELNLEAALRSHFYAELLKVRLIKLGMPRSAIDPLNVRPNSSVSPILAGIDRLGIDDARREAVLALHRKAVHSVLLKEQTAALIAFGDSIVRKYFKGLGEKMVESDLLVDPADVFMLSLDEVRQIAQGGCSANNCNNFRLRVLMRKRELADAGDMMPPAVIHGERAPAGFSSPGKDLMGRPGAGGYRIGTARVLSSVEDIASLEEDEVAIIPDTGIEWTPALERSVALIAGTGSMFSELLFLARERGVPAVIGLDGTAVRGGSRVSVDGFQGIVRVTRPERGWEAAELPDLSRPVKI